MPDRLQHPKVLIASGDGCANAVRPIDTDIATGRPGINDFRPLRKAGPDGGYFFLGGATASLNAFARRVFTTVLAGIWMASPVWGLRPVRPLGAESRSHLRLGIDSVSTRIPSVRPIHIAAALLH